MKIQITNSQLSEGIIITDVILRTTYGNLVEVPTKVDKMDFHFENDTVKVIDIGTTSLTPTVNNNVTALEFDRTNKTVKVLDGSGNTVMSASTNNQTVLVRVNFSTSTITVYQ
jgi:mevalonate kinase